MTGGGELRPGVLSKADVDASLAELAAARERPYYDAAADRAAADTYYGSLARDELADLVTSSHVRTPVYKPARELYPWIGPQPDGLLRSLYTGQRWEPEQLIRADVQVAVQRTQSLTSALARPGLRDVAAVQAEVEAMLPYNCEHAIPQSWFGKQEPMRGDLHHLLPATRAATPSVATRRSPSAPTSLPHRPPTLS